MQKTEKIRKVMGPMRIYIVDDNNQKAYELYDGYCKQYGYVNHKPCFSDKFKHCDPNKVLPSKLYQNINIHQTRWFSFTKYKQLERQYHTGRMVEAGYIEEFTKESVIGISKAKHLKDGKWQVIEN